MHRNVTHTEMWLRNPTRVRTAELRKKKKKERGNAYLRD